MQIEIKREEENNKMMSSRFIFRSFFASQDIPVLNKVALNKNGTVRRTNRSRLTLGLAFNQAKKGREVLVIFPDTR